MNNPRRDVEKCARNLRMLYGIPPHDVPSNICRSDGYFAASIDRDFDYDIREEAEIRVERERVEWEKARAAFIDKAKR